MDHLARLLAEGMRKDFSTIVVENKPGAAGRIAMQQVKNAKPDGQTLILTPSGLTVVYPHTFKKLGYDATKDFTPISLIARFQFVVVAGPSAQAKSIQDMVLQAKASPGSLTYGTPGLGTLPQFVGIMIEQTAGVRLNHVPFQGTAPAKAALFGGHIGYSFDVAAEMAEPYRAGKVRILAVTGPKRDPLLPEVPTLMESGIPVDATAWFAVYAPAGLAPDSQARLEQAVARAVKNPGMLERLNQLGYEPVGSSAAELAATQQQDLAKWEKPLKAAGLILD
ncbi:tripartite tricarboxylate transporter substrate binding protein [Hydrogenophaga sp. YM1]|uniref:Bug family tripartite tricarboxylate transporter substrate binding protein n=1 Tax=Hydrogenophaga sp. YM1 TaxID=2806262 RepID=UPI001EF5E784|nr:tripartite tricarboxylate transporter substrate binding protein [Hydrogenophaga sp. YM1]